MTSPTSDPATPSERAVEAYDSLPGNETTVDYTDLSPETVEALHDKHDQLSSDQPVAEEVADGPVGQWAPRSVAPGYGEYLASLPKTSDLVVEITVMTPDGRRFQITESQEYELDDEDVPKNYEFEDVHPMLERTYEALEWRVTH